jgi:hypothetical protein
MESALNLGDYKNIEDKSFISQIGKYVAGPGFLGYPGLLTGDTYSLNSITN